MRCHVWTRRTKKDSRKDPQMEIKSSRGYFLPEIQRITNSETRSSSETNTWLDFTQEILKWLRGRIPGRCEKSLERRSLNRRWWCTGWDPKNQGLNPEKATTELWPPNPNEFEIAAPNIMSVCLSVCLKTIGKLGARELARGDKRKILLGHRYITILDCSTSLTLMIGWIEKDPLHIRDKRSYRRSLHVAASCWQECQTPLMARDSTCHLT